MINKGLGRGLEALLPMSVSSDATQEKRDSKVLMLPLDNLIPNPKQPRKNIAKESLEELARSIKHEGIIQPLLVRKSNIPGQYEIIAGERRWRAARIAQLREVPVYVRNLTDSDIIVAALVENLQREDLNPAEEARALQEIKEKLSLTQEELALRLGKSRSMVANSLRLLQLPPLGLESLQKGEITAGHARSLLALSEDRAAMEQFLNHILVEKMSVRSCEDTVTYWKKNGTLPWAKTSVLDSTVKEKKAYRKKSLEFKAIEKTLSSLYDCKAKLSGSSDNGKISFSYKSKEELLHILDTLGLRQTDTNSSSPTPAPGDKTNIEKQSKTIEKK